MAKEKDFKRSMRNRGEDVGKPDVAGSRVGPERTIRRKEIQNIYKEMHDLVRERDGRSMARVRSMENEFYAGIDPRRRQEIADGGMIEEDNKAMANLSPKARHYEYPKAGYYTSQYLDDMLQDIDNPFTKLRNEELD